MSQNVNARVLKHRAAAAAFGWKRRDYYATPAEHAELKTKLKELRSNDAD